MRLCKLSVESYSHQAPHNELLMPLSRSVLMHLFAVCLLVWHFSVTQVSLKLVSGFTNHSV
jgi:hypothetical protein